MEDHAKKKSQNKVIPLEFNATQWIQTDSTNEYSHQKSLQLEEDFKKEHQQYLANKIKRRFEERRLKIQEFGDSSSEDEDVPPQLLPIKSQPQQPQGNVRLSKKPQSQISRQSHSPGKKKEKVANVNIGSGKKIQKDDQLQIVISSKKGVDVWVEEKISLTDKVVVLPHCQIAYYDISKLKMIFSNVSNGCFKLKITCKNEEYIFGASSQKQYHNVSDVFFIFSKIIKSKLEIMGKKPIQNLQLNSQGIPQLLLKDSQIYGRLIKKSRVISRWTEVFGVINREGLVYYKKITDKPDLLIPRGAIGQLWTRFQFHDEWLVVKLFQGSHKIQIGIPFFDQIVAKSWLFHLYSLIFKK